MQELQIIRKASGRYAVEPINGYSGSIWRQSDMWEWRTFTFGEVQSDGYARTLAEAKAAVQRDWAYIAEALA